MMTKEEIAEILRQHLLWLNGKPKGNCANLSGADLTGAYLHSACLRSANLSGANLQNVDLRGADLSGADMRDANLHNANLFCANLRCANLHGADMRLTYLTCANLLNTNLSNTNLSGATRNGYLLRHAPISVAGTPYPVLVFEEHIEIGCECHGISAWADFTDDDIVEMNGIRALELWRQWKPIILGIAHTRTEEEQ